jgi:hypothetical protein
MNFKPQSVIQWITNTSQFVTELWLESVYLKAMPMDRGNPDGIDAMTSARNYPSMHQPESFRITQNYSESPRITQNHPESPRITRETIGMIGSMSRQMMDPKMISN